MRFGYYAGASTAAAVACLLQAFHQRPNFYSATVYLSQSNACLLIITNLLLVMACSFMYALQRILYGPLRPIEIEQLSEKAWYAVLDTLLAMPSFREEVGGWLLTMFVLLLAGKVWGWIGEGRVDVLEQQPPANPRLFHARLATSLLLSVVFDMGMLNYCVETVVADPRPGMMVIFTFEFAILTIFSCFTLARYLLSLIEASVVKKQTKEAIETRKAEIRAERVAERAAAIQSAAENDTPAPPPSPSEDGPVEVDENEVDVPGWEEKRRYLFALEVFTDFIKLIIYTVFFTVSVTFNGLPMHIMRDVYMTFASFSKRVSDYVAYRKATSDMNSRYPDATTAEIRGDACIVCRENMVAWEQPIVVEDAQPAGERPPPASAVPSGRRDEGLRAKKLPCGHILHLRCLKAWLERQQVCPTCRRPVITATTPQTAAAAGGNQQAPGQPGQQQPPRPRARMFNLGPLRVGLLNAPHNQMQNILNQLQNPNAQNQNAANQQGPNHLGLQVPYANQAGGGQEAATGARAATGSRAAVPVNIQLMQVEQRIMQDAHNLGIEQQQLVNLRMMEAELARLRAQHIPAQQPIGTTGAQRQAQQVQQSPQLPMQYGHMPLQPGMPFQQPYFVPPTMEQLQGNATQQIGNGHESLPEGLVLPEGWTVVPLHRVRPPQVGVNNNERTVHVQGTNSFAQPDATQQSHTPLAPSAAGPIPVAVESAATSASQSRSEPQYTGPTDDGGSPLFIPAVQTGTNGTSSSAPAEPTPAEQPQATATEQSSAAQTETRPTWGGDSWSFVDQTKDEPSEVAETSQTSASSEEEPAKQEQQRESHGGKGKAKAVEMEDVPDPDAGT